MDSDTKLTPTINAALIVHKNLPANAPAIKTVSTGSRIQTLVFTFFLPLDSRSPLINNEPLLRRKQYTLHIF